MYILALPLHVVVRPLDTHCIRLCYFEERKEELYYQVLQKFYSRLLATDYSTSNYVPYLTIVTLHIVDQSPTELKL